MAWERPHDLQLHLQAQHPEHSTTQHVCPTQVNWIAAASSYCAPNCCAGCSAQIPLLCYRTDTKDEFRRCARCEGGRVEHDPNTGPRRRNDEAQAGLQRHRRLPNIVGSPQQASRCMTSLMILPAPSRQSQNESWMAVSLAKPSLLLCFRVLLQIYKHEL